MDYSAFHWAEKARKYAETYIHTQGEASDTWTIQHNLDKYPSVTVVDSSGNEVIAEVFYPDRSTCIVSMTAATKGKAYLN